jgi:predicted enzyme related to lactoylglutathione lyase
VISDAEGAVLMLLRATGGDPERPAPAVGTFGWAELWTRDVASAVRFYEGVFGYRALKSTRENAPGTVVLTIDDTPHAVIVAAPGDDILPNWLPYVPVADARRTLEEIERHGGTVLVTSDAVDDDSGAFAAIAADPTGGVFAIQDSETNE